jgi:hypothetical protein
MTCYYRPPANDRDWLAIRRAFGFSARIRDHGAKTMTLLIERLPWRRLQHTRFPYNQG